MGKIKKNKKAITPESITQHIEEEYKRSLEFRKAYDREVLNLKIAYRVMQLRKERQLTQGQLARMIGTKQQTISRIEDSKNFRISIRTLVKIASALKAKLSIDLVPKE